LTCSKVYRNRWSIRKRRRNKEAIIEEIKECVDEIKVDTLGNLIAVKKGKAKNHGGGSYG